MKKIITLAIAFLLIPFASINGIDIFSLNNNGILYVGGSGPNNYTSIQSAIDDAKDGYIIYVYPGYYNESIVINKSIALIGIIENGEKPVIHGNENNITVLVEANNCTINGFVILNGRVGLEIINSNYVLVKNINIVGCSQSGVWLHNSFYNTISNSEIIETKNVGMSIRNSSYNVITQNFISKNKDNGIVIFDDSNHNIISYNILTENCDGIDGWSLENCIISFNHVYGNRQYGIGVLESSNISILNNTIHDHNYKGLMLNECSNCLVYNNEMYRNQVGVSIEATTRPSEPAHDNIVTNNNIHENIVGVYLEFYCKNNQIKYNNLIDNDVNGYFWFDEKPFPNVWDKNYWSNWKLPLPKPIKGKVTVWWGPFYIDLQWFTFDKHPAMEPYGNFTLNNK